MTKRQRTLCVAAGLALAFLPAARGLTLELDPQKSGILFTFGATMHEVHGTMEIEGGRLQYDPASRAAAGRVVIDLTTAQTGNERRDKKMHAKILETQRYPQAVFTLERVTGAYNAIGQSDLQLHGSVDFHGATHPVTFPAEVRTENDRVTARGHLTIPYVKWGLDDPSFLLLRVSKTVDVTLEVAGTLRP
ncbi:MAG TPA: YceI family protein [Thermoanaerobaculia bacterium]